MADQWEYMMVVLSCALVKGKHDAGYHYMVRRLTADGQPSANLLDAPSTLNELGTAGWELATSGSTTAGNTGTDQQVLIFKRRKA